ncbi:hypothetical protein [Paenibacillus sp. AN1007]|uniref:DUF4352 domain-containing protein n=1 Tax=Paenibacillus sp. AN1007 TaxID=3151385 RepID=A0AAU8NEN1_9BACL
MEHTYGDFMTQEQVNAVSFVVISEDVGRTTYGGAMILKPIVKIETEVLPYHLKYSVSFGYILRNKELHTVEIEISNKDGDVVDISDITKVQFSDTSLYDDEGNRQDFSLIGDAGLTSSPGIHLQEYGKFSIKIKFNGEVLGETFFVVMPTGSYNEGVNYE